jgi:hypothetical protein
VQRHLDFLVMSEGNFTTDFFSKDSVRDMVAGGEGGGEGGGGGEAGEDGEGDGEDDGEDDPTENMDVEAAMAQVEDSADVAAMKSAKAEEVGTYPTHLF